MSGPTSSFTPPATTLSASMSRPESVSSSTAILRLQHRHLQDLDALLLAAREPVVQVARRELAGDLEAVHLREEELAELRHRHRVVDAAVPGLAHGVDRLRRKFVTVTPGIACGYWKARKSPACARSSAPASVMSSPSSRICPLGDLVGRVAGDRVGERRLARAVRAHDRVHLVRVDREVDALDDLRAVLERDVQSSSAPAWPWSPSPRRACRNERSRPVPHTALIVAQGLPTAEVNTRLPGLSSAENADTLAPCPTSVPLEISCLLLLALLLFGAKRLPEIGRSLGAACASSRTRSPGHDKPRAGPDDRSCPVGHAGHLRTPAPPRENETVSSSRACGCGPAPAVAVWTTARRRRSSSISRSCASGSSSASARSSSASSSRTSSTTALIHWLDATAAAASTPS